MLGYHQPPQSRHPPEQTPPPPGSDTPPADTPPGVDNPRSRHHSPRGQTPPGANPPGSDRPGSRLQHTVYERPVCILLECILVFIGLLSWMIMQCNMEYGFHLHISPKNPLFQFFPIYFFSYISSNWMNGTRTITKT